MRARALVFAEPCGDHPVVDGVGGRFKCPHGKEQKQQAEAMIKRLTDEKVFDKPIVTEVTPASEFYKAEDYHQNYYNDNPNKSYCAFVIQPKLNKFAKEFTDKIRPELLR